MKMKENIESLMQKFDNIRGFVFKGRARNHLPIFNYHGKWFFKYLSFGFLGFIHLLYQLMKKIK